MNYHSTGHHNPNDTIQPLWRNKQHAIDVHKLFQKSLSQGNLDPWKFNNKLVPLGVRVSINAISWIGGHFDDFITTIPSNYDDEEYQAVDIAYKYGQHLVWGNKLVVHGGYNGQRTDELENIIQSYHKL